MEKEINIENIMDAFGLIGKAAEKAQSLLDKGDVEDKEEAKRIAVALGMGQMITHPAISNVIRDCAREIEAEQKFNFEISNRAKE